MSEVVEAPQPPVSTNIKETIESILVAFILAFIFRAFVVEAFVIPTGSMAPTLLGAHMRFRCPDCGYVFDVNYSSSDSSDDMVFPSDAYAPDEVYCPNCGYHVANGPRRGPNGIMVPFGTQPEQVHYGDRILVLKYAYLFNEPQRGDVVVFKSPYGPKTYNYSQNFIKRLIGVPGDTLMALDGDIYRQDAQANWMIEQRPPWVQDALWRIIYNNDYYPQGLARADRREPWAQPWQAVEGSEWNLGQNAADGRVFRFSGQGHSTIGFNSDANPGTQTTNDYLVYDIPGNQRRPDGADRQYGDQDRNTVNDLKLELWYNRESGTGSLKLRLTKRDHAFVAEIDTDSVTLWHTRPDGTTVADAGPVKLADAGIAAGAPLWVQFTNVDYRVTLRLNGKDVLQTTAAQYAPDVEQLRREYDALAARQPPPQIQITAADQACSLSHVGLWRDIYYTNRSLGGGMIWATPDHPIHLHHRGEARENGTGVYDDDEYFVMGDNSLNSLDARYWNDPIELPNEELNVDGGRVPGRFMLGKAFFVYWPSGYRPIFGWPSIVPNFGDMRFIH
jgi:signal peptidase I